MRRNRQQASVNWSFTTADARTKLRRLYPSIEPRQRTKFQVSYAQYGSVTSLKSCGSGLCHLKGSMSCRHPLLAGIG
jgi:hypothetical protein